MNKRHKLTGPELLLLLVPSLGLVGWGAWLQSRGPAKPFQLVIDEVAIATIPRGTFPTPRPDKKRVQVIVFIGHAGPAPSWWGAGVDCSSRVHFTGKGEKDDGYTNRCGCTGALFDERRSQYTFVYEGEVPEDPGFLKQGSCHVSVDVESPARPTMILASAKASSPIPQLTWFQVK